MTDTANYQGIPAICVGYQSISRSTRSTGTSYTGYYIVPKSIVPDHEISRLAGEGKSIYFENLEDLLSVTSRRTNWGADLKNDPEIATAILSNSEFQNNSLSFGFACTGTWIIKLDHAKNSTRTFMSVADKMVPLSIENLPFPCLCMISFTLKAKKNTSTSSNHYYSGVSDSISGSLERLEFHREIFDTELGNK
eukprot:TRINITY_DN11692_c0_g1_i1.p1 TRINITY_DN11692_c0_g1~~TRINITY_DN11692_c0_g1_i1.p1  ORF type:complete len:204 (-),score=32.33 TRINITY_DN11692_c0_g1_i1:75-656(-)